MARPLLLLAVCVAASAFIRPVSHVRAARSIDVAAKKKRKGKPAAGGLQSLKVPQLKEKCRAAGLPVGGTKPVLIDRLQAATAPAAPAPAAAGAPAPSPRKADVIDPTGDALDDIQNLAPRGGKSLKTAVSLKRKALEERDAARAEAKRAEAGKGVAVLSTVSECHKRIDQLERRLTRVSDFCIELGADPDAVNELRYGPI